MMIISTKISTELELAMLVTIAHTKNIATTTTIDMVTIVMTMILAMTKPTTLPSLNILRMLT